MALALCEACPVRDDCLDAAIEEERGVAGFGIRGGLTADERRELAGKRRNAARNTALAS
jgi:hypothetical protein